MLYTDSLIHIVYDRHHYDCTVLQSKGDVSLKYTSQNHTIGMNIINVKIETKMEYRVIVWNSRNHILYDGISGQDIQCNLDTDIITLEIRLLNPEFRKKILVNRNISIEFVNKDLDRLDELIKKSFETNYEEKEENIVVEIETDSESENESEMEVEDEPNIETENKEDEIRILICSSQYPGYGGAATNAYEFIKCVRELGYKIVGVYIDNTMIRKGIDPDIDNIGGVFRTKVYKYEYYLRNKHILKDIREHVEEYLGGEPTICIGFNYIAPLALKSMYPDVLNVYAVTGSTYLTLNPQITSEFMKYEIKNHKIYQNEAERHCIYNTDIVLFNTNITKNILTKIYPTFKNKFYRQPVDLTKFLSRRVDTTDEREYDLLVVASRFDREIKNSGLIKEIFKSNPSFKKLAIGNNSIEIFGEIEQTECLELVSNEEVLEYMQKSKILLMPSFFESASLTVREANDHGCNVITSYNIGLSDRLSDLNIVETMDVEDWNIKINDLLKGTHKDIFSYDFSKRELMNIIINLKKKNKNNIRILVSSVDTPYIGGSATNAYNIIKLLRKKGYIVKGLMMDNTENDPDPDKIGDIYHMYLNKDDLQDDKLNDIYNRLGDIDVVFAKNYKAVVVCRRLYPKAKIISSPSGLRVYAQYCHKQGNMTYEEFYHRLDEIEINTELEIPPDLYSVLRSDKIIEPMAARCADLIVPNSRITSILYKNLYPEFIEKLYDHISLSNICYASNTKQERIYDIVFACYDWKRPIKNGVLVNKILDKINDLNILVIGNNYKKHFTVNKQNITYKDGCDHDILMEYLNQSKMYIIPSYYDSNPNTFVEAARCGCKIISTPNIGQTDYIPDEFIVNDFYNVNKWIEKIYEVKDKEFKYNGQTNSEVIMDIDSCINYITTQKKKIKSIGIYKIDPHFDTDEINIPQKIDYEDVIDISKVRDFIKYDLFYKLFSSVSMKLGVDEFHYIVHDPNLIKTQKIDISIIYPCFSGIIIWLVKTVEEILFISQDAEYYFLRGVYNKFYSLILNNTHNLIKSFHYRATSFKQDSVVKVVETPYDIILYDDIHMIRETYPNSQYVQLYKFANDEFRNIFMERSYDMSFVATDKQPTKNHDLFVHLINYLEVKKKRMKCVFVGDWTKIPAFKKLKTLRYMKLEKFKKLGRDKIVEVFNKTRVNILFSGRDCCPRVISESLASGCYNVATDTLSDGQWIYNGFYGEIVSGDPKDIQIKSGNKSYIQNDIIYNKIIKIVEKQYDHNMISKKFIHEFTLERNITDIIKLCV